MFIYWYIIRSRSLDFLNALFASVLLSEAISFYKLYLKKVQIPTALLRRVKR